MKRTVGYTALLLALLLLAFSIPASAETVTTSLLISPANEVPPITGLTATGGFVVNITVNRDANGAITGGSAIFQGSVSFPGMVIITGLHIHEREAGMNGPIRFDSGLSSLTLPNGVGLVLATGQITSADSVAALGRFLANPTGFYLNLHTMDNPGGAMRGQIVRYLESQTVSVQMTTAQEVPPITNVTASGMGTITVNPTRNPATGAVTGGAVTFTIQHDLPANSTIRGLHIHEQVAGMNGSIVIDTGISGSNTIVSETGKGTINFEVQLTTAAQTMTLQRLVANPAGFYVNLHTSTNPGGEIRGQLAAMAAPPIIQQSNTYFLETGTTDAPISLLVSGIDLTSSVQVNGQTVTAGLDIATGRLNVTIPAALRANAGTLFVQARTGTVLSKPLQIAVATTANVNTVPITTVDAAKFGALAAPDAIVAGFGTRLASTAIAATAQPLPFSLDGTSVLVNGISARLFFVSAGQANYMVPSSIGAGPAAVVVTAKDGTVTRGQLNISESAPSIFTMTANGLGAPAAVASSDGGVTFPIVLGNPDGTPREISAGNIVMLFGTGMRYGSTMAKIMIGTTEITPMFIGPAPGFSGLDQGNFTVPQSLAGAGEVNLTITMLDGKTSNPVRLRIRAATPLE